MSTQVLITDIAAVQRELMKIEPELKKAMVKDIKQVAVPVQSAIKSAIPQVAPLSGMNNRGRLGWNTTVGKRPGTVSIVYRSGSKRSAPLVTSLVSVNVGSAVMVMSDMAGKRNPNGRNARGAAMIRGLSRQPSRYVWPAAERALPQVEGKIEEIVSRYCRDWNIKA
jgi:hypothetical protein